MPSFIYMIQWNPLIVVTFVQSQFEHYKRMITKTEFTVISLFFMQNIICMIFQWEQWNETDSFHIYWILLQYHASLITYTCTALCADITLVRNLLQYSSALRRLCCAAGAFFFLTSLKIKFETKCLGLITAQYVAVRGHNSDSLQ